MKDITKNTDEEKHRLRYRRRHIDRASMPSLACHPLGISMCSVICKLSNPVDVVFMEALFHRHN
jgi:hypothetical protein